MKQKLIAVGVIAACLILTIIWAVSSMGFRSDESVPENVHGGLEILRDPEFDDPSEENELRVRFSHTSGFFDEAFDLELAAADGAEIFFTLDGSYPTVDSQRYMGPISVNSPRPEQAITLFDEPIISRVEIFNIRAIAVLDGEASEISTRSFVMGTDVFSRFSPDTLIFALTSDPHGLWDYYGGIFVEGVDRTMFRQEFFEEHGYLPEVGYFEHNESPASPANFNRRGMASEREVFVEMFDHMGRLHISQRAGMRVRGGFSRADPMQKSVELYAREEYGDSNNFTFAFFDDEFTHDGYLIERFRRIRLRNGGTDRLPGFIRDELSQVLFRQAGHAVTQNHRPAAVFLNGEYYGVAWVKSPRTANHLSRMIGGNSSRWERVDGGDMRFTYNDWEGDTERGEEDINALFDMAQLGFSGEEGETRFREFSRRVDVDELIRYYAMQIYINNLDWPNHNIEMWRYLPTRNEMNDETLHPFLRDGKWRVFAHDIEAAWSIWDDSASHAHHDTLRHVMEGGHHPARWNSYFGSAFLYAIVGRGDTREKLANSFVDLIEGAFAPDNVIRELDRLAALIAPEHHYALRMNMFNPDSLWWPSVSSVEASHDAIRSFARYRPQAIFNSIRDNLGLNQNERFAVTLTVSSDGTAVMNSRPVPANATVTGNYFAGTTITITAHPQSGHTIDHWLVNDVRHYGEYVTIDADAVVYLYFE